MAGIIDIITRAFAGTAYDDDTVTFNPQLPPQLGCARFHLMYRGQRLQVALHHDRLKVTPDTCASNPQVRLRIGGFPATADGGRPINVSIPPSAGTAVCDEIADPLSCTHASQGR